MTLDGVDIRSWRVLLIGGNSATGKSTLARALGVHLRVPWVQVDDFRLAMQQVTTPAEQAALHFFMTSRNAWQLPSEQLCDGLIRVASVVPEALRVVVAHHVLTPHPLILEGDGLDPAVAADLMYVDGETRGQVRAVFLSEDDQEKLLEAMLARGRGFRLRTEAEQLAQARASLLYGEWLRREAERHEIPAVPARPRETLVQRVTALID